VVVESENVVTAKLRSMGLVAQVQLAGRSATIEDVYIACTPARPEGETYAAMFSEGLLALRKSGELSRILERYGLRDWAASP
jgi:polar amino acid transport system substrate-binding protein